MLKIRSSYKHLIPELSGVKHIIEDEDIKALADKNMAAAGLKWPTSDSIKSAGLCPDCVSASGIMHKHNENLDKEKGQNVKNT